MSSRSRNGHRPRPIPSLHDVPCTLPGATRWSTMPEVHTADWLITTLKGMPDILGDLELAAIAARPKGLDDEPVKWGPERMPGSFVLAFLAFCISRKPDIKPWHLAVGHDIRFWKQCGFATIPKYQTVYQRFVELESLAPAFEAAAGRLMRRMRRRDPRIGMWWHFDASEAETNARPRHDCMPGDPCPRRRTRATPLRAVQAGEMRREDTEQAIIEDDAPAEPGQIDQPRVRARNGLTEMPVVGTVRDDRRRGVRWQSGGHFWYSRDPDAGTRVYGTATRVDTFWHGFLVQTVSDHFSTLPLTKRMFAATKQEFKEYDATFKVASENCGTNPLIVAGDRGYTFTSVYKHNTMLGIGSVFGRRRNSNGVLPDADIGDVHGVPVCRHCGKSTDRVAFAIDRGMPRVWVRCPYPATDACARIQTRQCSEGWKDLLPVERTEEAYAAMRQSHPSYEGVHTAHRTNYGNAPNSFGSRPKRIGMAWQQMRASAAVLIEWVRFVAVGFHPDDAEETSGDRVRAGVARRRKRLGLWGGGIDPEVSADAGHGPPPDPDVPADAGHDPPNPA